LQTTDIHRTAKTIHMGLGTLTHPLIFFLPQNFFKITHA
jgi:hypothetical protein